MHGDGNGLYLNVTPSGSRSWIQRMVIGGRRRELGLGGYPAIGLAEARALALANKAFARAGRDPVAERRRTNVPTFREAARRVYDANLPRWRNGKHITTWWQSLERHAVPHHRRHEGRSDSPRAMCWRSSSRSGAFDRKRLGASGSVFARYSDGAMAHDYCTGNAAGDALDGALPTMPRLKAHLRALPYREVSAALATVEASKASLASKLCLRFLVLTAARSGEARGATWTK